jgi:outer membrane protein assembly factor BamB
VKVKIKEDIPIVFFSLVLAAGLNCDSTTGPSNGNNPPETPFDPEPPDGATNVDRNAGLTWKCSDPDYDYLVYDVYFGTESEPPFVSEETPLWYDPGTLAPNTTYYWKVVAKDKGWPPYDEYKGGETAGPIWKFTTGNDTRLIWKYQTEWSDFSNPCVAAGKVYIGCDGYLYCLGADAGNLVWKYNIGSYYEVSDPFVADENVYVGDDGGYLYCFGAQTGTVVWKYNTGGTSVISAPFVAEGKVYVTYYNWIEDRDCACCLDAGNGRYIWDYYIDTYRDYAFTAPYVGDGKVYLGYADYDTIDGSVYCLDGDSGGLIWEYKTGEPVEDRPCIAYGKVYAGCDNGYIYCLDGKTGDLIWRYNTGGRYVASPFVTAGRVYAISDSNVHCLDAGNGGLIWEYKSDVPGGTPFVAEGKVYYYDYGLLYCLDANTGTLLWKYLPGEGISTNAYVTEGKIYVGGTWSNSYVYCLSAESGRLLTLGEGYEIAATPGPPQQHDARGDKVPLRVPDGSKTNYGRRAR